MTAERSNRVSGVIAKHRRIAGALEAKRRELDRLAALTSLDIAERVQQSRIRLAA
jgi:hypothetical protein